MARFNFAAGIPPFELGAYQRTVRALLTHPLLTLGVAKGQALKSVRRYAPQLQADLEALGYGFHLGAKSARLIKPSEGLSTQGAQGVQGRNRARPFDRRRYALLCLALAALEERQEQITLSDLAQRVRTLSESIPDFSFDPDVHHDRRAFVDAIATLEDVEVLTLKDGSSASWGNTSGEGEALYDIDRGLARELFRPPRPLARMGGVEALFNQTPETLGIDARQHHTRQRLLRWILERPALYRCDLSEADRAYIEREGRTMGQELEQLTGSTLERTREGVALIDAGASFTDRPFPTSGSNAQCALLLIDHIHTRLTEGPPFEVIPAPSLERISRGLTTELNGCIPKAFQGDDEPDPQDITPPAPINLPFAPRSWCIDRAQRIHEDYGDVLSAKVGQSPDHVLQAALETLSAHDLIRPVPGGVVLMPALGRYRGAHITRAEGTLPLFGPPQSRTP